MRYRNNLSSVSSNTCLEVTAPFKCFVKVGHSNSNTSIGPSRLLGNVYREVTLNPGDQIHDLAGGVFVLHGGEAHQATIKIRAEHPFVKSGPTTEQWPLKHLTEIPFAQTPVKYPYQWPTVEPGTQIGHGIDSVI